MFKTVMSEVGNTQYLTKYTGLPHAFTTQWHSAFSYVFQTALMRMLTFITAFVTVVPTALMVN